MRRIGIVVLIATLATACIENPTPKRARVVINGEAGKQVRLVISSQFVAAVNEQGRTRVVVIKADTVDTTLPFEKEINIEKDQQFLAMTFRLANDVSNLRMQVFIDARRMFDEGGTLSNEPFRFVYTFNRPVTRDLEII
jgi:hypothetical protein